MDIKNNSDVKSNIEFVNKDDSRLPKGFTYDTYKCAIIESIQQQFFHLERMIAVTKSPCKITLEVDYEADDFNEFAYYFLPKP